MEAIKMFVISILILPCEHSKGDVNIFTDFSR